MYNVEVYESIKLLFQSRSANNSIASSQMLRLRSGTDSPVVMGQEEPAKDLAMAEGEKQPVSANECSY